MMTKVLAVAAHPDDIEIMMAGTMLLLQKAGCELHYMTLSDGDCGSKVYNREETGLIRTKEAMNAAKLMGARFHASLTHDMQIFYNDESIRKLMAVMRRVQPNIILTHCFEDYMYDHIHTAQLAVSAAFAKGAPNYKAIPDVPDVDCPTAIYHAMPYGLLSMMRKAVVPDYWVNVAGVLEEKSSVLAEHKSQREWLKATQGFDSFIKTMQDMCAEMGIMSKNFKYAEGWMRHSHIGFAAENYDPLRELLQENVCEAEEVNR